jgi:peptidoglycan/LPS O-acetylase OafA/YrhL
MTNPTSTSRQYAFIEGLRGLAACQVVLLHYCSVFFPLLARVGAHQNVTGEARLSHSPLFLLIDGYSAVYVFFVMSGFVLAGSFLHSAHAFYWLALKRFVRLYLPVLAAFVCAIFCYAIFLDERLAVAAITHSDWLTRLAPKDLPWTFLLRDGLLNSMLMGYQGSSLFERFGAAPIWPALNAPTWTLHVEFWGSLLVVALAVAYRHVPHYRLYLASAALFALLGTSHYSLFVLGFLLYVQRDFFLQHSSGLKRASGMALLLLGLWICLDKDVVLLRKVGHTIDRLAYFHAQSDFHWQSQFGASLVFLGVMLWLPLQRWLSAPLILWLGKRSFSVYLLHFPILLSLVVLLFARLLPHGYFTAVLLSSVLGIALTLLAAHWFERGIDRVAVRFSRQLMTPPSPVQVQSLPPR